MPLPRRPSECGLPGAVLVICSVERRMALLTGWKDTWKVVSAPLVITHVTRTTSGRWRSVTMLGTTS